MKKNKLKIITQILSIIILALIVWVSLRLTGIFDSMSSLEQFKAYIEGFGEKAYIVFFLVQLLSIIIAPIPSNISAAAGAMVFGAFQSFIMTMLAIILGSIIVFYLARFFGKRFVDKFVKKEIYEKYGNIVTSHKGEKAIALMLLLPFFPDDMINFLVGLSNISFKRYLMILLITRPWGIAFSCFISAANIRIPIVGWVMIIATMLILIVKSSAIENRLVRIINKI